MTAREIAPYQYSLAPYVAIGSKGKTQCYLPPRENVVEVVQIIRLQYSGVHFSLASGSCRPLLRRIISGDFIGPQSVQQTGSTRSAFQPLPALNACPAVIFKYRPIASKLLVSPLVAGYFKTVVGNVCLILQTCAPDTSI